MCIVVGETQSGLHLVTCLPRRFQQSVGCFFSLLSRSVCFWPSSVSGHQRLSNSDAPRGCLHSCTECAAMHHLQESGAFAYFYQLFANVSIVTSAALVPTLLSSCPCGFSQSQQLSCPMHLAWSAGQHNKWTFCIRLATAPLLFMLLLLLLPAACATPGPVYFLDEATQRAVYASQSADWELLEFDIVSNTSPKWQDFLDGRISNEEQAAVSTPSLQSPIVQYYYC